MSQQYHIAANILQVAEKGKSLKSYCASLTNLRKSEYALALQTFKYLKTLKEILEKSGLSPETLDVEESMLYVMLYDLLMGKGKIQGGGQVKKIIMEHKDELIQAKTEIMKNTNQIEDLLSDNMKQASTLPIYVRINQFLVAPEEAFEYLDSKYTNIQRDELITSLIELPASTKGLSQDPWVKDGKLIIQDKASCFPAQILFNHWKESAKKGDCIDACAAPGNKTSHLASLIGTSDLDTYGKKKHTVFAFDKSKERAEIIKSRIKLFGIEKLITVENKDFFFIEKEDGHYSNVKYILLDPSCSGSGIIRNIERIEANEKYEDNSRLKKLQAFQSKILTQAMSFPQVDFVVYSTCSIHCIENEEVVRDVLNSPVGINWKLSAPKGFESWTRRGIPIEGFDEKEASKLIRCLPEDQMNGFFVAVFERVANHPVAFVAEIESNEVKEPAEKKPNNKRKDSNNISHQLPTKKPKTHNNPTSKESNDNTTKPLVRKFSISKSAKQKFKRRR